MVDGAFSSQLSSWRCRFPHAHPGLQTLRQPWYLAKRPQGPYFSKDSLWDVMVPFSFRVHAAVLSCVDVLFNLPLALLALTASSTSLAVLGVPPQVQSCGSPLHLAVLRCGPPHSLGRRGALQVVLSSTLVFVQ